MYLCESDHALHSRLCYLIGANHLDILRAQSIVFSSKLELWHQCLIKLDWILSDLKQSLAISLLT